MCATKTLMTAEQLLEMADSRRLELVRGELVELAPIGEEHWDIVGQLTHWIRAFVNERKLGRAGPELGCILSRNPDVVRAPDVAFISKTRLQPRRGKGFFAGAPDLAVEIISPADKAGEVQEKIHEYLASGTRLVWLVDPQSETVTAYYPSRDAHIYSGQEEVSGEDVLPGFSFRPADLFHLD